MTRIEWDAETPGRTAVRFQLRVAASPEALAQAAWQGPAGEGTSFAEPCDIESRDLSGEWVQYRAVLDTKNGAQSPILSDVRVHFR